MKPMQFQPLYLCICALCWLFASTAQAQECRPPISVDALSPSSKQILFALSAAVTEQQRYELLRPLVMAPATNVEQDAAPLHWRAYLVYAALLLQRQDYAGARQHLKKIPLESMAAVPAALLLAESWRLQGETSQAVDWLVRIARQYPYNLEALEGLLAAANALEQQNLGGHAAALYQAVTEQANHAAAAIVTLASGDNMALGALISEQNLLPGDLQTQLVRRVLTINDFDVMAAHHNSSAASSQGRCLLLQLHAYQHKTENTRQILEQARSTLAAVDQSLERLSERETLLRATLKADDYSVSQLAIRQELRSINNQLHRDRLQRQVIAANLDALPTLLAGMEKRLQAMATESRSRTSAIDGLLDDVLDDAAASLYVELVNTAAEAALRRAALLESQLLLRTREVNADPSAHPPK
jgi:hypothetical protein